MFRTEYAFTLPMGYVDADGALRRSGTMRLATAADEILPLRDPRVQKNSAYLIVILLSRVVVDIEGIDPITPAVIEGLFAADLAYLQDLYNEINRVDDGNRSVVCPNCRQSFELEVESLGGIGGYPVDQLIEEVAFLCYHLHWTHDDVMNLEHRDRRLWATQVSQLNERANALDAAD